MSAPDLLRRAAAKMRENAKAATMPDGNGAMWFTPKKLARVLAEWHGTESDRYPDTLAKADAEHIASWHPGVALAVADWLDLEAATLSQFEPLADLLNVVIEKESGIKGYIEFGRDEAGEIQMRSSTLDAAVAAARAYLGEDA